MRDGLRGLDALHARALDLDGEPQLPLDHRLVERAVHQHARRRVRAGNQLPQHQPPEPAELHRGNVREQADAVDQVRFGLQAELDLQHERAKHLRPARQLDGVRGVDDLELPEDQLRRLLRPPQPAPYYTTLTNCSTNDVPYKQLSKDIASGALPAFSFVTPNAVDDMHNGTIAQGDNWLAKNVPVILNSSAFKTGTLAVFLTWDEGKAGAATDCATNTTDVGCHVATLVISPSTAAGTSSATLFNHYGLLATTETLLKLPLLGAAAGATNMISAFNL